MSQELNSVNARSFDSWATDGEEVRARKVKVLRESIRRLAEVAGPDTASTMLDGIIIHGNPGDEGGGGDGGGTGSGG